MLAGAVRDDVLRSPRYRWLAPRFAERIAAREAPKARTYADAVKRTKRRLHQVFGAYGLDLHPDDVARRLQDAKADGPDALRDTCRALMERHVSTRERLPVLDRFYAEIYAITGRPGTIIDVACGLGPLALGWIGVPPGGRYDALDVDRRIVEIAAACLAAYDVRGRAELRDVVADPPDQSADVAFLLKSVPCLDHQGEGSALRVLDTVRARHAVISFPTRSLAGSARGMAAHYRNRIKQLLAGRDWTIHETVIGNELIVVVEKGEQPAPVACRTGSEIG